MNIEQILRAASEPITSSELRAATSLSHERVYEILLSMEASGEAKPIMHAYPGGMYCTGWIWIN